MEENANFDTKSIGDVNELSFSLSIPKHGKYAVADNTEDDMSEKGVDKEERFGHLRIHSNGQVSYKKINTTFIMKCTQLGIQETVGNHSTSPERDVLMEDFMTVESNTFSTNSSEFSSPRNPGFVFKTYAPTAFRHFRDLFGIKKEHFVSSFCETPLAELPNPGASGSLLYLTQNDEFLIKTVQHKEANFLQKLLPGYYLNLNQNPLTLLPKFFGLYCFQRDSKNVRLVVMNNVLPSCVKIHQKYDLKGSTYNRKASKREIQKDSPTFKDLDFMEHHPEGLIFEYNLYRKLMKTIQRDCRVLESFQIIDYSLLVGVHYLNQTKQEKVSKLEGDISSKGDENNLSSGDGVLNDTLTDPSDALDLEARPNKKTDEMNNLTVLTTSALSKKVTARNTLPGLPARKPNGEKLLLFVGIIDILQSYRLKKRLEHVWKSCICDGDSVSVHNPAFYSRRFQEFLTNNVFKCAPVSPRNNIRKSVSRLKNSENNTKTLLRARFVTEGYNI